MSLAICYIDEAGCLGELKSRTDTVQPVFVLTSLMIKEECVRELTQKFVALKVRYFPGIFAGIKHELDAMMLEIKGSDLRKDLRGADRKKRVIAEKFIDEIIALVMAHDGRIASRIWVKGIGMPFKGDSIYTKTTQKMAGFFQQYLADLDRKGIMICDFRRPGSNAKISHSVFTQKHKRGRHGDAYPNIFEAPTFGISDNHAGLQIVDLITSALIFPMACHVYCTGHVENNLVVKENYVIWNRHRARLRSMQYTRFKKAKNTYGFSVHDPHANLGITDMWR